MDTEHVPKLALNTGVEKIPNFHKITFPQPPQHKFLSFQWSVIVGDASFTLCFLEEVGEIPCTTNYTEKILLYQ